MSVTWYDAIFLQVRVGGDPRLGVEPVRSATMQLPGGEVDIDELIEDVENIGQVAGAGGCGGSGSFKSNVSRGHTSWGADGSSITAVLDVALALGEMALWDAMKLMLKKYSGQGTSTDDQSFRHDWTDDELIGHARRALTMQHGWVWSAITPTRIERGMDPDAATVSCLYNNQEAEVSIRMINGIAIVIHSRREIGPDDK